MHSVCSRPFITPRARSSCGDPFVQHTPAVQSNDLMCCLDHLHPCLQCQCQVLHALCRNRSGNKLPSFSLHNTWNNVSNVITLCIAVFDSNPRAFISSSLVISTFALSLNSGNAQNAFETEVGALMRLYVDPRARNIQYKYLERYEGKVN